MVCVAVMKPSLLATLDVSQFCCSVNTSTYSFFFFAVENSCEVPFSFWSVKSIFSLCMFAAA
jgi:hypothetical protein